MADGHWLDPLARSLLEASGQLPARPKPAATPANQSARADRQGAPGKGDPGPSSNAATANATSVNSASDPEAAAIERELLALKLRHNPGLRLGTAAEVRHAAALGWRLDVNRATAPD